jgi:hypothetical protein
MVKITIEETAKLLGCRPDLIRQDLQRTSPRFTFGVGFPPEGDRGRWYYFIQPGKLADWLGITLTDLEAEVLHLREADG